MQVSEEVPSGENKKDFLEEQFTVMNDVVPEGMHLVQSFTEEQVMLNLLVGEHVLYRFDAKDAMWMAGKVCSLGTKQSADSSWSCKIEFEEVTCYKSSQLECNVDTWDVKYLCVLVWQFSWHNNKSVC
jgi:hypothetical protein